MPKKLLYRSAIISLLAFALIFSLPSCHINKIVAEKELIKSEIFANRDFGKASLRNVQGIPVLELYGGHRQMGEQYGMIFKEALQAMKEYLDLMIPKTLITYFLNEAKSLEETIPGKYLTELRAMAEAAEIDYNYILALNVIPRMSCSALAVWGDKTEDGKVVFGRNSDFKTYGLHDRGSVVVVYHPEDGNDFVSIGFLGMMGVYTAFNESGLSVANLLVSNADYEKKRHDGTRFSFFLREIIENYSSVEECLPRFKEHKFIIPMNSIIADKREVRTLELGVDDIKVNRGDDFLAITNSFSDPKLYDKKPHCKRLKSLHTSIENDQGLFTIEDMMYALYHARWKTRNIQAMVFVPESGDLHLSINNRPASDGPYRQINVYKLLQK